MTRPALNSGPKTTARPSVPAAQGLYDPANEHDACGVGMVCSIKNIRSRKIVEDGLKILCNLEHRGAVGADPKAGDGAGILIQLPHEFFAAEAAARGNLRQALYNIRCRFPGETQPLSTSRQEIRFSKKIRVWVDVLSFEEALDEGEGSERGNPHLLTEAVGLYRGDFLAGFHVKGST